MKKKKIFSKFMGVLTGVVAGSSLLGGMSGVAYGANSDVAQLIDRYGNEVDVDAEGFKFAVFENAPELKGTIVNKSSTFDVDFECSNTNPYTYRINFRQNGDLKGYVEREAAGDSYASVYDKDGNAVNNPGIYMYLEGQDSGPYRASISIRGSQFWVLDHSGYHPISNEISSPVISSLFTDSSESVFEFTTSDDEVVTIPLSDFEKPDLTNRYSDVVYKTYKGQSHEYVFGATWHRGYPSGYPKDDYISEIRLYKVDGSAVVNGSIYDRGGIYASLTGTDISKEDSSIFYYRIYDTDRYPKNRDVMVMPYETPEPNSENMYNFIKGVHQTISKPGDKWKMDLSVLNDIYPVEKRELYTEHLVDVDRALKALNHPFQIDYTIGDSFDKTIVGPYGSLIYNDYITNYYKYGDFTNMTFEKSVSGYTATEDFEFIIIQPTVNDYDFRRRFNISSPSGQYEYNSRLNAFVLSDEPQPMTLIRLCEYLPFYFDIVIPRHFLLSGSERSYADLISAYSTIEKMNPAQMFMPLYFKAMETGVEFLNSFGYLDDEAFIDEYVDNIKVNTGGVFDAEAEHLRKSLKAFNWLSFFTTDYSDLFYGDENNEEAIINIIKEYENNLLNAGYNTNDFALMYLASSGAAFGADKDFIIDHDVAEQTGTLESGVRSYYERLVKALGIEDKVTYTEFGLPKVTLKAGETITFKNPGVEFNYFEDGTYIPILIYEKNYNDAEDVINRTFVLGFDENGTTNIYPKKDEPVEEPTEEIPTEETPTEETPVEEPIEEPEKETPTEISTEESKEEIPIKESKEEEVVVEVVPDKKDEVKPEVKFETKVKQIEKEVKTDTSVVVEAEKTGDVVSIAPIVASAIASGGIVSGIIGFKRRKKS